MTCRYQHFEFSYIKDLAEPSRNLADSTGGKQKASKKEGEGGEEEQEREKDVNDK